MRKLNVMVIFGGVSTEHDISIITAMQTMAAMDEYLYNIIPVYVSKSGVMYTSKKYKNIEYISNRTCGKAVNFVLGKQKISIGTRLIKHKHIDVALVCMHGKNGEDGTMCSALKLANIPYTSADIIGSAIGMDKVIFKDILKSLNINYVPYVYVTDKEYNKNKTSNMRMIISSVGLPAIIKPATQGSSIGIEVCKTKNKLQNCIKNALKYDKKVLIEKYLPSFRELNVAIYYDGKLHVSNIEEPIKVDKILSFDNKYLASSKGMQDALRVKPNLPKDIKNYITDSAIRLYNHLGLKGVVRFDYILSDKVYLNEINTIPGSMANYLFDTSFTSMIDGLIGYAIRDHKENQTLINYFESSVLDRVNMSRIKK